MSSTQQEIKEYIKDTLNDPYYQHYPEDYAVVRKLYDIFTCRDPLYMYICMFDMILCVMTVESL